MTQTRPWRSTSRFVGARQERLGGVEGRFDPRRRPAQGARAVGGTALAVHGCARRPIDGRSRASEAEQRGRSQRLLERRLVHPGQLDHGVSRQRRIAEAHLLRRPRVDLEGEKALELPRFVDGRYRQLPVDGRPDAVADGENLVAVPFARPNVALAGVRPVELPASVLMVEAAPRRRRQCRPGTPARGRSRAGSTGTECRRSGDSVRASPRPTDESRRPVRGHRGTRSAALVRWRGPISSPFSNRHRSGEPRQVSRSAPAKRSSAHAAGATAAAAVSRTTRRAGACRITAAEGCERRRVL